MANNIDCTLHLKKGAERMFLKIIVLFIFLTNFLSIENSLASQPSFIKPVVQQTLIQLGPDITQKNISAILHLMLESSKETNLKAVDVLKTVYSSKEDIRYINTQLKQYTKLLPNWNAKISQDNKAVIYIFDNQKIRLEPKNIYSGEFMVNDSLISLQNSPSLKDFLTHIESALKNSKNNRSSAKVSLKNLLLPEAHASTEWPYFFHLSTVPHFASAGAISVAVVIAAAFVLVVKGVRNIDNMKQFFSNETCKIFHKKAIAEIQKVSADKDCASIKKTPTFAYNVYADMSTKDKSNCENSDHESCITRLHAAMRNYCPGLKYTDFDVTDGVCQDAENTYFKCHPEAKEAKPPANCYQKPGKEADEEGEGKGEVEIRK